MNLYLISRNAPGKKEWDYYDSAVVAAESEEAARMIRPDGRDWDDNNGSWASDPKFVSVVQIGVVTNSEVEADEVVLASFNAG